jgi:hypothetical protein
MKLKENQNFPFIFCGVALAAGSAMSGVASGLGCCLCRHDPMQHSKKGSDAAVFVCSM